ncbi:hypothetical protein L227DRAFT_428908 [Lentinus tigrinus ALCF2SS1-6]|uniref:Uncharacterized protein n=1 Tax=Lentinus tigrinus ALCF2SS1-6 TaxID=1328759 RepID=A0A5C2SM37_9APHY|nr:hypothetical protein L227DRAFT_428908 [Lentinus tigrinus ALCF2SS1-6]
MPGVEFVRPRHAFPLFLSALFLFLSSLSSLSSLSLPSLFPLSLLFPPSVFLLHMLVLDSRSAPRPRPIRARSTRQQVATLLCRSSPHRLRRFLFTLLECRTHHSHSKYPKCACGLGNTSITMSTAPRVLYHVEPDLV